MDIISTPHGQLRERIESITRLRELIKFNRGKEGASEDEARLASEVASEVQRILEILDSDINAALVDPSLIQTETTIWVKLFGLRLTAVLGYVVQRFSDLSAEAIAQMSRIDQYGSDPLVAVFCGAEEITPTMVHVVHAFLSRGLIGLPYEYYQLHDSPPLHTLISNYHIDEQSFDLLMSNPTLISMVDAIRLYDVHTPLSLLVCQPISNVRYHRLWRTLTAIEGRECPNTLSKLQSVASEPRSELRYRERLAHYYMMHSHVNGFMATRACAREFWEKHQRSALAKGYVAPHISMFYRDLNGTLCDMLPPGLAGSYCCKRFFRNDAGDSRAPLGLGFCLPSSPRALPMSAIYVGINEDSVIVVKILDILISLMMSRGEVATLEPFVSLRMQQGRPQPATDFERAMLEHAKWTLTTTARGFTDPPSSAEFTKSDFVVLHTNDPTLVARYHVNELALGTPHQTLYIELDLYHLDTPVTPEYLVNMRKVGVSYVHAPSVHASLYSSSSDSSPTMLFPPPTPEVSAMSEAS